MRSLRCFLVIISPVFWLDLAPCDVAAQPQVWTGLTKSFSKPGGADWTMPEFQDRITPNAWFTRADTAGLFNIAVEDFYDASSPADTRWATSINNGSETIGAANWQNLAFTDWTTAYGGMPNVGNNIVGLDAVVHLIVDDIYLDIRFTEWGARGGQGLFTYWRAVPEPGTLSLGVVAAFAFGLRQRRGPAGPA
jgi:hypothetical protein